jgi:glycosyltransferase involved in cell wall biosynthesis
LTKRIAILHYASPPVVGGVESTIAYQARILTEFGYSVRVVSGDGAPFDDQVESHIQPLFSSRHPDVLAIKAQLDRGIVPPEFGTLVQKQAQLLADALQGCEVCIAHNVPTFNKNLALSVALSRMDSVRVLAWCHDLAWTNPQYLPELHEGYPWEVLKQVWANARYVTVSEPRRLELAEMLDILPETISVITPGVDPARFFRWTEMTRQIEARLNLLDSDAILLLPARLTRRKNVALGLHVLSVIRKEAGLDYRLIVTGPPGPHNPANPGYLAELLAIRERLGLQNAGHFLYELSDPPLIPDDDTMANLYQLADGLFFPSLQEGFGIPVLEAGLAGLPVFCSDIPPFRHAGGEDVSYFDPEREAPEAIAARIIIRLDNNPTSRLRRRIRREFRWERIIRDRLLPLLEM